MDNQQPYYVTYKFYDERGRRLSIFCIPGYETVAEGEPLPEKFTKLFIWVIPCSKKDNFQKAVGKELFNYYLAVSRGGVECSVLKPIEFQIDVKDDKPKWTFLKWCEENYFKQQDTIIAMVYRGLWRGEENLKNAPMVGAEFIPVKDMDAIPQDQSIN